MNKEHQLFTDTDAEYERRKNACDFRNNSQSTFNYLQSCIQTAVESLEEDGVSQKEIEVFIDRTLQTIIKPQEDKDFVTEETRKALQEIYEAAAKLEKTNSHTQKKLAKRITREVEDFTDRFKLELDSDNIRGDPQ